VDFAGLACPYVFTFDPIRQEWTFETTILYELDGPQKEIQQLRALDNFDGRLIIWEIEPEISYIDQLYLQVMDSSGRMWTLETNFADLQTADNEYLTLHQGDKLYLEFHDFDGIEHPLQIWLVAEGYYEWLGW
jgi:hypothetical protein